VFGAIWQKNFFHCFLSREREMMINTFGPKAKSTEQRKNDTDINKCIKKKSFVFTIQKTLNFPS